MLSLARNIIILVVQTNNSFRIIKIHIPQERLSFFIRHNRRSLILTLNVRDECTYLYIYGFRFLLFRVSFARYVLQARLQRVKSILSKNLQRNARE